MGVVDPTYFDIPSQKVMSLNTFAHGLISVAKRRLHMRCNQGYNPGAESIGEASQAIRQSDHDRRNIGEVKDTDEQQHDLLQMRNAQDNEAKFEDDVLIYLVLQTRDQFTARVSPHFPLPEQGTYARAHWFSHAADTEIFGMAFGARPITDECQERARDWYGDAALLEDEIYGRGNAQGQVHHKMHDRFERYFRVTCEAAEVAMQGTSRTPPHKELFIIRNIRMDRLLEALSLAKTRTEKEAIIAQLKELH